jgi:hypothetical protein
VVEIRNGASFGQVGFGIFGLRHSLWLGNLDGDETLQLVVVGEIDHAETTLPQQALDPIAADVLRCRSDSLVLGRRLR